MSFPEHLKEKSLEELISIVERNRWNRLQQRGFLIGKSADLNIDANSFEEPQTDNLTADEVKLVLFSSPSAFTFSIIEMFKVETVIAHFQDPEEMIAFCLDHSKRIILLDLDPPTDSRIVNDVFVSLYMLLSPLQAFACTSRKDSVEAKGIELRGASIIAKPILRKQVKKFHDTYLK